MSTSTITEARAAAAVERPAARFLDRVEDGAAGLVLSGAPGMGKTVVWSDAIGAARTTASALMSNFL